MNKKSLFVCFLIGLIIFSSITACKKPEETGKDNVAPPAAKWTFIPYDFFTHKSDFYEDMHGNIAYRTKHTLYLFDNNGNLQYTEKINIPNNESIHFNFTRDGSFFWKIQPASQLSSDFVLYYKRLGPFSYSRPTMIDIRKLDSLNRYISEYYIHDIISDNLANRSSTSVWILASKYPDVSALYRNSNPQPVMIELNTTNVGTEYLLPKDVFYARAVTSSSHITLFSPSSQTLTFDRGFSSVGKQQANSLIPNILVMGNYVVKTANGYYLSQDMI